MQKQMRQCMIGSVEPTDKDFTKNKWLHEVVNQIRQAYGRPKGKGLAARFVPIASEDELGPPDRCPYNVADYVEKHPGSRGVRCFKVYAECTADHATHVGAKAVMHYVVQCEDGKLLDVTCEPGDRRTFCVPANWFPDVADEQLRSCCAHMGGFVCGTAQRVQQVLEMEGKDTMFGVAIVTCASNVRLRLNDKLSARPWNGVTKRDDKDALREIARECKVRLATVERWAREAVEFCARVGIDLDVIESAVYRYAIESAVHHTGSRDEERAASGLEAMIEAASAGGMPAVERMRAELVRKGIDVTSFDRFVDVIVDEAAKSGVAF